VNYKRYVLCEVLSGKILMRKMPRGRHAWKCLPPTSPWMPDFMTEPEAEALQKDMESAGTPSVFVVTDGAKLTKADWRKFCVTMRKAHVCF